MWHQVENEIAELFESLQTADLPEGFHLHEQITLNRATRSTRSKQTSEERARKRAQLEHNRRAYKARKMREAYAYRKAFGVRPAATDSRPTP